MENNEQIEETQESSTEDVNNETQENGQEETKDWKAEALKYKAIAERKDKKLQEKPQAEEINKTNEPQTGLSREETIFFAQGGTEETYAIAKKIADAQGVSILVARKDDYFKFEIDKIQKATEAERNEMGPSNGSQSGGVKREKPLSKMTRDEHKEHFESRVNS